MNEHCYLHIFIYMQTLVYRLQIKELNPDATLLIDLNMYRNNHWPYQLFYTLLVFVRDFQIKNLVLDFGTQKTSTRHLTGLVVKVVAGSWEHGTCKLQPPTSGTSLQYFTLFSRSWFVFQLYTTVYLPVYKGRKEIIFFRNFYIKNY